MRPTGGVAQVATSTPFHGPVQYHAFPNNQALLTNEYYEIFRTHGHPPWHCPILRKSYSATNTLYCEFCGSSTHGTERCRALDALADRLDRTTSRVAEGSQEYGAGCGRGIGGFWGGRTGGRGAIRCYNYDEIGHLARDFPLPQKPWCSHCRVNTYATEECPKLIAKW